MKIGTYVGLRVLRESAADICNFATAAGIPVERSSFERRLHTTLIYSRKHSPDVTINSEAVFHVNFKGYTFFKGQNGENVLVMLLNAPTVEHRHLELMEKHGLLYDYPIFHPHITLHYNYPDNSLLGIPMYNKPIQLGLEYTEDIILK